ncbi:putative F-box/FBD/LRR-repeat protein At3g49480 isoform X1 [Nicotiana sylvestris]|uniref:Uncharacterized protein LOC104244149 isoform X3 n=1 Tax=Nicotiana sylvestris TaxID=4096 RepID=A0A1U7Y3R1_NICSY|nr:PREDICTED: uncharacterized protein LOC104244149 isoform X3 [Nicotiana sylvestris]
MQVMMLLLKYSPNLEVLKLWSEDEFWSVNWKLHDPDESIVCLESHLKSIQLNGFKGQQNEIELLRFFLKNAQVLEKLTIVWDEYASKSEKASVEVLKFPRTSSHVFLTFRGAKPKPSSPNWRNKGLQLSFNFLNRSCWMQRLLIVLVAGHWRSREWRLEGEFADA